MGETDIFQYLIIILNLLILDLRDDCIDNIEKVDHLEADNINLSIVGRSEFEMENNISPFPCGKIM